MGLSEINVTEYYYFSVKDIVFPDGPPLAGRNGCSLFMRVDKITIESFYGRPSIAARQFAILA